jgi:hypothetical protein
MTGDRRELRELPDLLDVTDLTAGEVARVLAGYHAVLAAAGVRS